jgi:hypothetical protein
MLSPPTQRCTTCYYTTRSGVQHTKQQLARVARCNAMHRAANPTPRTLNPKPRAANPEPQTQQGSLCSLHGCTPHPPAPPVVKQCKQTVLGRQVCRHTLCSSGSLAPVQQCSCGNHLPRIAAHRFWLTTWTHCAAQCAATQLPPNISNAPATGHLFRCLCSAGVLVMQQPAAAPAVPETPISLTPPPPSQRATQPQGTAPQETQSQPAPLHMRTLACHPAAAAVGLHRRAHATPL